MRFGSSSCRQGLRSAARRLISECSGVQQRGATGPRGSTSRQAVQQFSGGSCNHESIRVFSDYFSLRIPTSLVSQQRAHRFRPFRTFSSGGGSSGAGGASGGGGGGGGGGSGGGGFNSIWLSYLALLDKKPVLTKSLTAAFLNGVGDIIAQLWLDGGNIDLKRLGIFSFIGLVLIGPALHVWYGSLSRLVTAAGSAGAIGRLMLDQFAFAPIFIGSIVSSIMALEGHAKDIPSKLRSDLPTILKSNWIVWIPFQFINFRFVPVRLQVLAANMVALVWNTYVSWASHNSTG